MIKNIIKHVLFACVIAAFVGLFYLQTDDDFQKKVTKAIISSLEKDWDAQIKIKKARVNFLTRTITFEKGCVFPHGKTCNWSFGQVKVRVSLRDLLFKKKLYLYLSFYDVTGDTSYTDETFDLIEHLARVFTKRKGKIDIISRAIGIHNLLVNAAIQGKKLTITFDGDFVVQKKKNIQKEYEWKGFLQVKKGSVYVDNKPLFVDLSGSNEFHKASKDQTWTATIMNYFSPSIPEQKCSYELKGAWNKQGPWVQVLGNGVDVKISKKDELMNITGKLPVPVVGSFYSLLNDSREFDCEKLAGMCSLDLHYRRDKNGHIVWGRGRLDNFGYGSVKATSLRVRSFMFDGNAISSEFSLYYNPDVKFVGRYSWDKKTDKQDLSLCNISSFEFNNKSDFSPSWMIHSKDIHIKATRKNKRIAGSYKALLSRTISDERVPLKGLFELKDQDIVLTGNVFGGAYDALIQIASKPFIKKITYKKNKKDLVSFSLSDQQKKTLKGSFHFSLVQALLDQNMKRLALGSNTYLGLAVNQDNLQDIQGSLWIDKGRLYLPESRNIISNVALDFTYLFSDKKLIFNKPVITFCQGTLTSDKVIVLFGEKEPLKAFYAPVSLDKLFLNWKNDFYTFASGSVLFCKQPQGVVQVDGDIVLKKSLLKNNPFADRVQRNIDVPFDFPDFHENGFELILRVKTERPIKVKTESINTKAAFDVSIEFLNNDEVPKIEGNVDLEGGFLQFLNNKLFIEYGKVQFISSQMNDPLISLIARNRINKYLISLHATGSLQKPNILFESSPSLREEQILGLLLAGSEHATLQADLPVMVMQNLHTLLLGGKKGVRKANAFFEKLTRPLKYIQITPNFTDQSGRGGIKGIVSIDLGKQFHAQIQKNFNLQDDLAFQVEYLLSDDIHVKAVKDQRGELGSEVEVRFKF